MSELLVLVCGERQITAFRQYRTEKPNIQDLHERPRHDTRSTIVEELPVKVLAPSWIELDAGPEVEQHRTYFILESWQQKL